MGGVASTNVPHDLASNTFHLGFWGLFCVKYHFRSSAPKYVLFPSLIYVRCLSIPPSQPGSLPSISWLFRHRGKQYGIGQLHARPCMGHPCAKIVFWMIDCLANRHLPSHFDPNLDPCYARLFVASHFPYLMFVDLRFQIMRGVVPHSWRLSTAMVRYTFFFLMASDSQITPIGVVYYVYLAGKSFHRQEIFCIQICSDSALHSQCDCHSTLYCASSFVLPSRF